MFQFVTRASNPGGLMARSSSSLTALRCQMFYHGSNQDHLASTFPYRVSLWRPGADCQPGKPAAAGGLSDACRRQLRPALPARDRGLAGSLRALRRPRSAPRSRSRSPDNRTGDHWHVRVDGLPEEFCYGYRVDGPKGNGHRFDPSVILLDPYSRALSCGRPWGTPATCPAGA